MVRKENSAIKLQREQGYPTKHNDVRDGRTNKWLLETEAGRALKPHSVILSMEKVLISAIFSNFDLPSLENISIKLNIRFTCY